MEKILLTTRIRNGDRKAFDELCGRYYAMLVSYARLFMKDDWAEDVVQDVFYNVWQNRAALDDSNSLYKYLAAFGLQPRAQLSGQEQARRRLPRLLSGADRLDGQRLLCARQQSDHP